MNKIITAIRAELKSNADEKTKLSGERFFREAVTMYGIKSSVVKRISKDHYNAILNKDKSNIFSLCDELWKSGMMEDSIIACNWSDNVHKQYKPEDIETFDK